MSEFKDDMLDAHPTEVTQRQKRMARATSMPREQVLSVTPGAPAYRGVVTAMKVAGEEVIIMAKDSVTLMTVHQKLTAFAEFRLGLVHKAVILSNQQVQLDDEL